MKKLLLVTLSILLFVGISSCETEEDVYSLFPKSIVGTNWTMTKTMGEGAISFTMTINYYFKENNIVTQVSDISIYGTNSVNMKYSYDSKTGTGILKFSDGDESFSVNKECNELYWGKYTLRRI